MPAIVLFIRGQHPQGVRRGCKGLKPQQHTQGPLLQFGNDFDPANSPERLTLQKDLQKQA